MDNKTNTWKWMVGLLAVLNIVLLITIWRQPQQKQNLPPMGEGPEGPARMIIEQLKLSPPQIEQFEKLKQEHRAGINKLRQSGKGMRDRFFNLLKNSNPDEKSANALADSISYNQKEIELVTFNHFKEVRKICNEEQQKRFDEIINDVLHSMARPGRGPGKPEGPPPPHE